MEGGAILKSIVIETPGGPEQLVVADVPEPTPGSGELLVEVTAAGLNYIDTYHRTGLYPVDYPMTPGVDGAGVVGAIGDNTDGFAVGDRVAWPWVTGSYSEKLVVPLRWAVPIPDTIDDGTAVATMVTGLTAHYLATDTFPLSAGDRCLVHAGAGGVGLLLTQICKIKGADVVTTVGSEEKAEVSRAAGADRVIIYTQDDFKTVVEDEYGPNSLDVVYDGVGAATFEPGLDLLRPRGMMVTFGNASGPVPEISPLLLSRKGSLFLTRPTMAHYLQTREELSNRTTDLFQWIGEGRLEVRIGAEFPLEEAADAHRALESRQTIGKVLLRP
jgi:NADPH2:quinone reductase